jgi:SAM-dependent methyltransferase
MHPVNRVLSLLGLRMYHLPHVDRELQSSYRQQWEMLRKNSGGYRLYQDPYFDGGSHPRGYPDLECEFATFHLRREDPRAVLDIGSYRGFIIGLLSRFDVTTLDIRERIPGLANETVLTCDAKKIELPSNSFQAVVSLCSLEHFGLGRYGDEFDPGADKKAFDEMVRVLAPGGILIFSTTFTRATPAIAFNAHRVYDRARINDFCRSLELVEERFIDHINGRYCPVEEITDLEDSWDVYCGCWRKP